MIYDTFTFFNELELLELRLHELDDVVDRFVLVEATRTFQNEPKPLWYAENQDRFSEFHEKIIHVIVDDMPQTCISWGRERHQRNCISRGLRDCRPDDIILISDLDEIPRASAVRQAASSFRYRDGMLDTLVHSVLRSRLVTKLFRRPLRKRHPFVLAFEHTPYLYYLNGLSLTDPGWNGTRMLFYRDLTTAEEIRYSGYKRIRNAGWHFGFMGGADRIRVKLLAGSHTECNTPEYTDINHLRSALHAGEDIFGETRLKFVELDETFPRYLLEHREKFSDWIRPL